MSVNILNRIVVAAAISAVSLVGMSIPTNAQQQPQKDQKQQQKQKKQQQPAQKQQQPQRAQQQPAQKQQQPQRAQQQPTQKQQQPQRAQQQPAQKQQQPQRAQQQPTQRQQQPQRAQQQQQQVNRPSQQGQRVQQGEQPGVWQQHRASSWQTQHQTWQQRGGYNGYRIPANRFSGYFGSNHGFRIYSLPLIIVGGYPRFQYGGYWFSLIDPWPEYWSADWYQNDDLYIDYSNDGYYLYNRRYPGPGLAISVFVN